MKEREKARQRIVGRSRVKELEVEVEEVIVAAALVGVAII
jgi:hypothetical protein